MSYELYFPRGIAQGDAFCNREQERTRLIANINSRQHSLIMSPRRYGKTSVVKHAIRETGLLFGEVDLFIAVDAKRIEQQLLMGIKNIVAEVSSSTEQVLEIIRQYFKKTSAKWTVGTQGFNIALLPELNSDPATSIMEALSALEDLLKKKNIRAVFFIDEMQQMGEVAEGEGIEGAIRHVAQQTHYLSFIFSGSNRHLLAKMFYDKSRPLYKLCDRILLTRIEDSHYKKHLNHLAEKRWQASLENNAFETLLLLTERHPFYINSLCFKLWDSDLQHPPSSQEIENYWLKMVEEERQEITRELSVLSAGQKILLEISKGHTKSFTGKILLKKLNMSSSSVVEAIKSLEQRDYIEKINDDEYHLIDPLTASALRLYFE